MAGWLTLGYPILEEAEARIAKNSDDVERWRPVVDYSTELCIID